MSSKSVCSLTDQDVSTLPAVLNSIELSRHLQRILPSCWGALRDTEIRVIRNHRGKRCTVAITLRTTTGWRHLIGKVYPNERSDIYQIMNGLRQVGFGPEAEFSIPQPLAYLPLLRLLLYEKFEGPRADEVFLTGNEQERATAANRCARWLAQFQAITPQPERILGLKQQLACIERWSRPIVEGAEPSASKASHLLKQLRVAAWSLDDGEMCASHGDFGTRNVILSGDSTVVYDWDSCKLASPCRDVASFIVDLSRLALRRLGSIRALDTAAKTFKKTYSAVGCREALSYLPFYQAGRCLQVANIIFRKQQPHWRENVEVMIDEGSCALSQWLPLS